MSQVSDRLERTSSVATTRRIDLCIICPCPRGIYANRPTLGGSSQLQALSLKASESGLTCPRSCSLCSPDEDKQEQFYALSDKYTRRMVTIFLFVVLELIDEPSLTQFSLYPLLYFLVGGHTLFDGFKLALAKN